MSAFPGPRNATHAAIEDGLRAELIEAVGRHRYRLWFRDLAVADVDGERIVLDVPTEVHRTWMEVTFGDVLRAACERVLGPGVGIEVRTSAAQAERGALRDRLPQRAADWEEALARRRPAPTFEAFVASPGARFAPLLLERLGRDGAAGTRGPFVLVGPQASGKSHLLRALEGVVARRAPGSVVALDAGALTQRYVAAVRARDVDALKAFEMSLASRDLVLLDDVDHLADRSATQEELVRLLDRAAALGRPTWVLALREGPQTLQGLSDRLRCRLLSGLVATLRPVHGGEETVEVLTRRAAGFGVELPQDVARAIQRRASSLVGALGILDRWAVASALLGAPLDVSWLDEVAPGVALTPSEEVVRRVKDVVARHFGLDHGLLERPTKMRTAAFPRRVAMYLVYRACALPLGRLGQAFGLRSHSSVSRAVQEVRDLRERDASVEQLLDGLLARV